jgi:class 3 adenylate cyclase
MDLHGEVEQLRASLKCAEKVQGELDHRVFYLKTLYDVGQDIFSSVESETILRNFLLMTMGNFGVTEGFLMTLERTGGKIAHFVSFGYSEDRHPGMQAASKELLLQTSAQGWCGDGRLNPRELISTGLACALPFTVSPEFSGVLGLGAKLIGDGYDEDEKELLLTLLNNLVIALKNARSFEQIRRLNRDLQARNAQLQAANTKLMDAMRKLEILESIKASLSKFVPSTVRRLIEESPTAEILESRDKDVSVLFLDIEGYTKICEQLCNAELNQVIERCFSVVMDAIHANNGDVNEAAGDGLMVLFLHDDETTNALEAVRTAHSIRGKMAAINAECKELAQPLVINIGINSGRALVGAAKFESYAGSRWTYTARGMITNVAARIGALATGGAILVSRTTADRVKDHFQFKPLGAFKLKNVSEEVEVFSL